MSVVAGGMIGVGVAALAVGLFLVRARFASASGAGRILVLGPVFEAAALANIRLLRVLRQPRYQVRCSRVSALTPHLASHLTSTVPDRHGGIRDLAVLLHPDRLTNQIYVAAFRKVDIPTLPISSFWDIPSTLCLGRHELVRLRKTEPSA